VLYFWASSAIGTEYQNPTIELFTFLK